MGMLATVMNALAMRDALERANIQTVVMSSIPMSGVVEHYDRRLASGIYRKEMSSSSRQALETPFYDRLGSMSAGNRNRGGHRPESN